ncbi:MAG: hypothetical protein NT070_20825 [Cyanobacteria bacterium]|nr:hypothetical protein [Cyanobacteriota bacterium]
MTIYSPTGIPINFPIDYAFTLLARLSPRYSPHRVLKIADGMDKGPESVSYLIGFITFSLHCSLPIIFTLSLIIPGVIRLAGINSKYINEVVYLGVLFTSIGKLGLLTIGLLVFGFHSVGWQGVTAFVFARLVGSILNIIVESQERLNIYKLSGIDYGEFDRCFVDAYRFCANRVGVTLDISVSDEELEKSIWQFVVSDYARKNPVLFEMKKFD